MLEALFQPMHLIALVFAGIPLFLIGRALWRVGSKEKSIRITATRER